MSVATVAAPGVAVALPALTPESFCLTHGLLGLSSAGTSPSTGTSVEKRVALAERDACRAAGKSAGVSTARIWPSARAVACRLVSVLVHLLPLPFPGPRTPARLPASLLLPLTSIRVLRLLAAALNVDFACVDRLLLRRDHEGHAAQEGKGEEDEEGGGQAHGGRGWRSSRESGRAAMSWPSAEQREMAAGIQQGRDLEEQGYEFR